MIYAETIKKNAIVTFWYTCIHEQNLCIHKFFLHASFSSFGRTYYNRVVILSLYSNPSTWGGNLCCHESQRWKRYHCCKYLYLFHVIFYFLVLIHFYHFTIKQHSKLDTLIPNYPIVPNVNQITKFIFA